LNKEELREDKVANISANFGKNSQLAPIGHLGAGFIKKLEAEKKLM
jgi:hypothetical protein